MPEKFISNQTLLDSFSSIIRDKNYDSLHVIADFDRTLTYNFVDGVERPSFISVLRSENIL
jgi:hypothetical protein